MPLPNRIDPPVGGDYTLRTSPCEHEDHWIVMPGVGMRCEVCNSVWPPEAMNKETEMESPRVTIEQIQKEYKWGKAVELLPMDFFVLKDKPDSPIGALHVYPHGEFLARVAVEGPKVFIEKSILNTKVKIQNAAFDSAGMVNPAKLCMLFPGKDVDFRPTEEWTASTSAASTKLYQCEISGKLVSNKSDLKKVVILNPEDDSVVKEVWAIGKEIPR